jgi:ABC-type transport system involved in cytochrome c biogenesis ATPase subunit
VSAVDVTVPSIRPDVNADLGQRHPDGVASLQTLRGQSATLVSEPPQSVRTHSERQEGADMSHNRDTVTFIDDYRTPCNPHLKPRREESDMLLEFSTANFRSIRERQTLSLAASNKYTDLRGNLAPTVITGRPGLNLLKGAALYGPNASGKSNVLRALWFMAQFVATSAVRLPEAPTGAVPFAFDSDSRDKPSSFEAYFVVNGVLYQYGYAVDASVVHQEFLYAFPSGRRQRWFVRTRRGGGDYDWQTGRAFRLDAAVRTRVRPNTLLLSVGPHFNDARLLPLHRWFASSLSFASLGADPVAGGRHPLAPNHTAELIQVGGESRRGILDLLQAADVGVSGARVTKHKVVADDLDALRITLQHRGADDRAYDLDLDQESAGTRRFFDLAGPWLDTMERGHLLLLDELETSLHPVLVQELIRLFFGPHNLSGAQVIFTTHDPLLLDSGILRRDQVWFTERRDAGGTCLYPLSDFKPRNDELLLRGYISGRYGALPSVERELERA